MEFHARVNAGFAQIAEENPARIRVVVSNESKARTAAKVFAALSDMFEWMADGSVCDEDFFKMLLMKRDSLSRG